MPSLAKAQQYKRLGKFNDAEKELLSIIDLKGFDHEIASELGELLLQQSRIEQGATWLSKAITAVPKIRKNYEILVQYSIQFNLFPQSLNVVKAMANNCVVEFDFFLKLAKVYGAQNYFPGSSFCYWSLSKLQPENPAILYNLGNSLRNEHKYQEAIKVYLAALELDAGLQPVWHSLASVYILVSDSRSAEQAFKRSLLLKPDDLMVNLSLAVLLIEQDRLLEALPYIEKAEELDPNNKDAMLCKAPVLLAMKRYQDVLLLGERFQAQYGKNASLLNCVGLALGRMGELAQSMLVLRQAANLSEEGLLAAFPGLVQNCQTGHDTLLEDAARVEAVLTKKGSSYGVVMINASFALANLYDKTKAFDKAFPWLERANAAVLTRASYQSRDDEVQFSSIQTSYASRGAIRNGDFDCDLNPVFVLGMPRSGTSLVEQILDSHSAVTGCGELNFVNDLSSNLGLMVEGLSTLEFENRLKAFRDKYLLGVREHINQSQCFVDKMPGNFKYIGLILNAFPNAKIVHCQRSPVETAFSIYKHYFSGNHPYAYSIKHLKRYYVLYDGLMTFWGSLYGTKIYDVKYEALVDDFENQTRQLLQFCDLEFEPNCLEFYKTKRVVATASSAQVRQPLYRSALQHAHNYPDFVGQWDKA